MRSKQVDTYPTRVPVTKTHRDSSGMAVHTETVFDGMLATGDTLVPVRKIVRDNGDGSIAPFVARTYQPREKYRIVRVTTNTFKRKADVTRKCVQTVDDRLNAENIVDALNRDVDVSRLPYGVDVRFVVEQGE